MKGIIRWMADNRQKEAWYEAEYIGQRPGRPVSTQIRSPEGNEMEGAAALEQGTMRRVHSARTTCSILNHFPLHQRTKEWQLPQRVPRAHAEKPHWEPPPPSGHV
eukprot:3612757-Rhodomonas_salina.1